MYLKSFRSNQTVQELLLETPFVQSIKKLSETSPGYLRSLSFLGRKIHKRVELLKVWKMQRLSLSLILSLSPFTGKRISSNLAAAMKFPRFSSSCFPSRSFNFDRNTNSEFPVRIFSSRKFSFFFFVFFFLFCFPIREIIKIQRTDDQRS